MNKEQVAGKKDQLIGGIKELWGKLTHDEVAEFNGNAQKFYGTVEEKYGLAREEAEKKVNELKKKYDADSDTRAA